MLTFTRPLAAGTLTIVLLLTGSPAAAVEPSPAPSEGESAPPPEAPLSHPTIHAEMAPSLEGSTTSFEVGGRPAPLAGAGQGPGSPSTNADGESGSVLALPNGLSHEVFGYLPWWELSSARLASMDYDLVSTIAFFGVPARSDGTLLKSGDGWNGWNSTHMTNVINAAHAERVKVVLTVTMMAWSGDYSAMTALLTNSTRRTKLANEIAATVSARNADGVNLDFEPMPVSLKSAYTAFVRDVRVALGPDSYLTVATTGGAATWNEGYDLPGLVASGAADAIMVMGYDFNWGGSSYAGGVAPINSSRTLAVAPAMNDFVSKVPASRLIWGVPYYGRAWTTTSTSQNSQTCSSSGTCSAASWAFRYDAAMEAIKTYARRWDATGQVPWYLYASSTYGTYVQSYFEDAQSLGIKYDLVETHGMRGVGIWHLLMDGQRRELWNELARNFKNLPYSDIEDSTFWQDIVWLSEQGITSGCGGGRFCPKGEVRRDEMAAFISRALGLPGTPIDYFTDDTGSTFEVSINRIAAAAITAGCAELRYCPTASVTRAQMASFLDRALGLPPATRDHFSDDDGTTHEGAINRLAEAGIASGCDTNRFCGSQPVTREQMAAFLHRALGD